MGTMAGPSWLRATRSRTSCTPNRQACRSWKSVRRAGGSMRCRPNPRRSGSHTMLPGSLRCSSKAVAVLPPPNGPLIHTSTTPTVPEQGSGQHGIVTAAVRSRAAPCAGARRPPSGRSASSMYRKLTLREAGFGHKLGPDLGHFLSHRGVSGRVCGVDRAQRRHQDRSGGQAAEPLVVGGHDVPGRPPGAGMGQHVVEGLLVFVPVAPLPDVAGRELPVLVRMIDPLEEPSGLLFPGQVEHDLDDVDAVTGQVAFPVVDLPVAAGPDVVLAVLRGQMFRREQVRVHPDHEYLLVVRPVEDADLAPAGQGALAAPQEVVVQLFRGGLLEGVHGYRLRVDPAHHVRHGAGLTW